eukprot:6563910-Prymnesium_polylepis.1
MIQLLLYLMSFVTDGEEAERAVCDAVKTKWLYLNGSSLNVSSSALPTAAKPYLNLVTIFGAMRTGKSTMLNILANRDVFAAASDLGAPCTSGAHVSPVLDGEFGGILDTDIAFVDVEGHGENTNAYDIKLLSPLMLASRVIIFNIMKVAAPDATLKILGQFKDAAGRLRRGNPEGRHHCGHLLIVLQNRDPKDAALTYTRLIEYEDGPKDGFEDRNAIRRGLKDTFESISVHHLPVPVSDANHIEEVHRLPMTSFRASYLSA